MNPMEEARILWQLANLLPQLQRLLNLLHLEPLTDPPDAADSELTDRDNWLFPELRDSS